MTPLSAISGPLVDRSLLVLLGIAGVVMAFLVLRRSAKWAVGIWLGVICFIPVWIGFNLGGSGNLYVPIASGIALIVIVTLIPGARVRFTLADGLVLLLVAVSAVATAVTNSSVALSFLLSLTIYFVVGYALGRLAPHRIDSRWIYGAVGVIFTVVAVLAIVESLSRSNIFVNLRAANLQFTIWGGLQYRGGTLRVEGAFGHSIALGSSLAIAIPLTLASRLPSWLRTMMVLVMLVATTFTFSRVGILGAILGLVLSILFLRDGLSRRMRVVLASGGAAAMLVLFPVISAVLTAAGSEASGSAAYRGNLLSLVGQMEPIGVASSARKSADGQIYFGNFRSIDSQLILTGLSGGTIVLAAIVVALLAAIVLVLAGKASAATIAIVAQIPAFATVALITQYSIFVWFIIGLAVTSQLTPGAKDSKETRGFRVLQTTVLWDSVPPVPERKT
ncbi:MAG: hypothetical protein ABI053_09170 [Lacisediminihabitans sp.]